MCYYFLETINTHGLRKVRLPLPEVVVSLINMQIRQALQKKIFSITLTVIVVDTFIWCLFPHFYDQ